MAESKALEIYEELEQLTRQIAAKEQLVAHVKKHGKLPEAKPASSGVLSYAEVKDKIRKLNDLISKTNAKLKPSAKPANASKVAEWEEKVYLAEQERKELIILRTKMEDAVG